MSKKRILFIIPEGFERGGIQTVVMNIVRSLNNEFVFDVIQFSNLDKTAPTYEDEFLSYGGMIYNIEPHRFKTRLSASVYFYLKYFLNYKRIKKIIKSNNYSCVHSHLGFFSGGICKLAKKNGIKKMIVHFHTDTSNEKSVIRKFSYHIGLSRINKYATLIIGPSQRTLLFKSPIEKKVVFNSYDDNKFKKDNTRFATRRLELIQVGSLSLNKNQAFSIDVVKEIKEKGIDVHLSLIGWELDCGYKSFLLERICENQLVGVVEFFNSDSDIPLLLKKSNYLLFPSISEGFGMVLIEAQAIGLKCFVSSSVPNESNVGGCINIPLDDGPKKWAEVIANHFCEDNGKHYDFDCAKFAMSKLANVYRSIYD